MAIEVDHCRVSMIDLQDTWARVEKLLDEHSAADQPAANLAQSLIALRRYSSHPKCELTTALSAI
jgi:hypothetical protein